MSVQLSDPIPTGSWCLYYHNPVDSRWTADSYEKIAVVGTWGEFFAVVRELTDVSFQQGMFFWLLDGIPPLYENHANIKGGCYSLRISRQRAVQYFMLYTLACFLGSAVTTAENQIQGISISPKRIVEKNQSFNVIKIWNKDAARYNKADQLRSLDNVHQCSEIIYTPHIQKKL